MNRVYRHIWSEAHGRVIVVSECAGGRKSGRRNQRAAVLRAVAAAGLLHAAPALADTSWTNAQGDNNWNNPLNWSNGLPSDPGNVAGYAYIANVAPAVVDGTATTGSNYIWVGAPGSDGTVIIQGGGTLSTSNIIELVGSGGSAGYVFISGSGSQLNAGTTYIGAYDRVGHLLVENGGVFNTTYDGYLGQYDGSFGTVTVTGADSAWNTGYNIMVGGAGGASTATGILTISDGGLVSAGAGGSQIHVAPDIGNTGVVNIGAAEGDAAVAAGTLLASSVVLGQGDASLVFNHTDNAYSFSTPIAGIGQVSQLAGTTILSGVNTWSGLAVVEGGELRAGVAGALSSGNTVVVNGGTLNLDGFDHAIAELSGIGGTVALGTAVLTVNQAGGTTFAGVISGTGSLTKQGAGTLTLTGTNSYGGGTTITAGTLAIGNGGTSGSIAGDITNNAALAFNRSDALTYAGNITGTGSLQKLGTGTTVLTGDAGHSGGTTITAGTLAIGNGGTSGSIAGDITNNAALAFNRSDALTYAGNITGTGSLTKQGGETLTLTGVNSYQGSTTIDAGIIEVATGGSIISSVTTVNAGGFIVNGLAGSVNVLSGFLGGTGTVGGTTIYAGGTLAPGNPIGTVGTIGVNGNLIFDAGANYDVDVSPTDADRTNVTGAATLAGGVNATYQTGTYTAKRYTILNATNGITGTFGALTNANKPSNINAALSYDANNAYLDLTLSYTPAGGSLNTNQQSVSNALTNYFNTTGGIPAVFTNLSPNDLSQISGQPAATMPLSLMSDINLFIHTVSQRGLSDFRADAGGSAIGYAPQSRVSREAAEAFAALPVKAGAASSFAERWSVWAAAYGGTNRVSGDDVAGTNITTSRAFGMAVGANYKVAPGALVGFAVGGADNRFTIANGFGSGKADVFHAALYGRQEFGQVYVAGLLGYAWQDAETDRTVTVAGTDILHASYRPQAFSGRAETGYRLAMPVGDVTPYGAVQVTSLRLPAYAETATSGSNQFAMSYEARTATTIRSELGLRLENAYAAGDGIVTLRGRAAWAHDWRSGQGATSIFQTLPGAIFTVNGAEPDANSALISAGIGYAFAQGWSVAADFDGEFSGSTNSYAGRAQLRRSW
jgi:T5SS/PEP-CTERM-associated repeat protein/autotransporter-associated beta strand protein